MRNNFILVKSNKHFKSTVKMQNTRVKNLFSTILGVGVVAGGMVLSSCEDEFTEQDAIKAQQESLAALKEQDAKNAMDAEAMTDSLNRIGARVDYTVTVVAANEANTGNARTNGVATLDGVDVTVTQGGNKMTVATEGGIAVFEGLKTGSAVVTVGATGAGYSSVTYSTLLGGDNSEYRNQAYSVGTMIPVFPVTEAAGATIVKGKAYAEFDATNDMAENATDAIVQATISVKDALTPYSAANGNYGGIKNATYEGFKQTATVDENGDYTLIVPTGNGDSGSGIVADIEFLPFEHDQTYVKLNEDGSLETVTEKVIFGNGDVTNHINENLPSIYMEIEAPTGVAEGFEVKAELNEQTVFESDIEVTAGGTGYTDGDTFELSVEGEDTPTTFQVSVNGEGQITGTYSYVSTGAKHTKKPTVKAKTASGTGASFAIEFQDNYSVVISNPGSGYWVQPLVTMVGMYEETQFSSTILNGGTEEINGTSIGETGDVIGFDIDSDVEPTFTVINPVAKKAIIDPRNIEISEEGTIENMSPFFFGPLDHSYDFEGGAGYMSSPKVTFKNAKGEEVNAKAIAVIMDGEIVEIQVTNPGSGIRATANDTDHEELEDMEFAQTASPTLKPGSTTNVMNHNYGGGSK